MKKITQKWIEFAKKDIRDAEILFKGRSYEGSIWHCHQALEKILKAIIVEKDKRIPKIHDLPRLSKECEITFSKTILEFLEEINPYYNQVRYPDTALEDIKSSKNTTQKYIKTTKEIFKWLQNHLIQFK
ncbi:MAG: hypothetical protein UR98_C0022G0002 [Parcubacteria group bacterium GW2011_GWA1_36_12]|nr:MAG: hypothetical protein UR98_C0022G0002 [Parcubacteria group bacterium GW2011_GWA1_36_12]